jgi:alkaline phosphatase D
MTVQNGAEQPLNVDAWDGYLGSKNRTLQTLYENNIGNNIVIAGDTHVNWVSDLTWLDHSPYDPRSGAGAIGVEFGGTAVSSPSSFGQNISSSAANEISKGIVGDTESLQWSEGYYRGYFELQVTAEQVRAHFFGLPTTTERGPDEISLANFTVKSGHNRLERNEDNVVSDGVVANGFLRNGEVEQSDMVYNTETGRYHQRA